MRTIPVPLHGAHQPALRAARRALAQGEVVGLFPEGGISRDGRLMLGNPGAMSLVLGEQVPIVPAGIVGASRVLPFGARWPRPARVDVRFGAPIPPDAFAEAAGPSRRRRLEAGTRLLMEEIARLTGQVSRERVLAEKNRRS
jgi:1-acyl-sn-glycerol-3-phosphate acyltransferase